MQEHNVRRTHTELTGLSHNMLVTCSLPLHILSTWHLRNIPSIPFTSQPPNRTSRYPPGYSPPPPKAPRTNIRFTVKTSSVQRPHHTKCAQSAVFRLGRCLGNIQTPARTPNRGFVAADSLGGGEVLVHLCMNAMAGTRLEGGIVLKFAHATSYGNSL